jgi:hypothetical protein
MIPRRNVPLRRILGDRRRHRERRRELATGGLRHRLAARLELRVEAARWPRYRGGPLFRNRVACRLWVESLTARDMIG